jgi:hypothetical protein
MFFLLMPFPWQFGSIKNIKRLSRELLESRSRILSLHFILSAYSPAEKNTKFHIILIPNANAIFSVIIDEVLETFNNSAPT